MIWHCLFNYHIIAYYNWFWWIMHMFLFFLLISTIILTTHDKHNSLLLLHKIRLWKKTMLHLYSFVSYWLCSFLNIRLHSFLLLNKQKIMFFSIVLVCYICIVLLSLFLTSSCTFPLFWYVTFMMRIYMAQFVYEFIFIWTYLIETLIMDYDAIWIWSFDWLEIQIYKFNLFS